MDHMWSSGQPNGKDLQECAVYSAKTGKFHDWPCSNQACLICSWKNEPEFKLRGLCPNSIIDQEYVLLPKLTYQNNLFFYGYENTNIVFSQRANQWLIIEDKISDLFKTQNETIPKIILGTFQPNKFNNHLPIGTNFWTLTDIGCQRNLTLKLTYVSKLF